MASWAADPSSRAFAGAIAMSIPSVLSIARRICSPILAAGLHQAKLQLCRHRHQALVPGWIQNNLDAALGYVRNTGELALDVSLEHAAHHHTRGGKREAHVHSIAAFGQRSYPAVIHEAEVHDVDWDLRVVACFQLLPDHLPQGALSRAFCAAWWGCNLFSDSVSVAVIDADHVTCSCHHRVGAAQRLRNP